MENKKEIEGNLKEHIRRIAKPIFDKVLKETSSNHRMVGFQPQKPSIKFYWQPHNCRLYFDFSRQNFNHKKPPNHTLQKFKTMVPTFNTAYTYTSLNYNSEYLYDNFMCCQIRVKKNTVEVINKTHLKQWREIVANSIDDIDEKIDIVMEELKKHSINALKCFIELHGGQTNLKILKERSEHGIHGEDYIDKINQNQELIIHDTYFKKVYKKKLEMLSVTAVKNYMTNRSVEKIAPDISNSINNLNSKFDLFIQKVLPPIEDLSVNMETHVSIMKKIEQGIGKFNKTVDRLNSRLDQKKLGDWI